MGSKRSLKGKGSEPHLESEPTKTADRSTSSIPTPHSGGDFPRGGASGLSSVEYREVLKKADQDSQADNLFLAPVNKKPRTKAEKKKGSKPTEIKEEGEEKDWLESFSIKSLAVGTQMLGVISSISALKMFIALPNLMVGTCELTDVSEPYRNYLEAQQKAEEEGIIDEDAEFHTLEDIFCPGQYVLCSVKEIDVSSPPYKLKLTIDPHITQAKLNPEDIQRGMTIAVAVKSHEDHGIQLDLGLAGLTGFLPLDHTGEEPLPVGRVVLATVQKANSRVVTVSLTAKSEKISKSLSNIESLLPGMLVEAKVSAIYKNGLGVSVMGFYDSEIEMLHLPASNTPLLDRFPIGTTLQARVTIVSISAMFKTVQLSLLSHVLHLRNIMPVFSSYPTGHRFEQVQVIRAERLNGLLCIPEKGTVQLYSPLRHLEDGPMQPDTLKKFKMGTLRPARVIGSYALEGLLKISLAPSITNADYIMFETLQLGQRVKGTVVSVSPGSGVVIRLSDHVASAFIPALHASDFATQSLAMKYKEGQTVQCRVLGLEEDKKRVFLTCKKSLLSTTLPIVTSSDQAVTGLVTHCVILKVVPSGCVVGFWNKVVGFAPLRELFSGPSEDPTKAFRVGQVVKCTVKAPHQGDHITVSFRNLSNSDEQQSQLSIDGLELGGIVGGTVTSLVSDGMMLQLDAPKANAFLSFHHLSDYSGEHCLRLAKTYAVGDRFDKLVVLNYNSRESYVVVSAKPLFISCMQSDFKLPTTLQGIHIGSVIPCFVSSITDHGIYVSFFGRISTLVSAHFLPNGSTAGVSKGQTVLALVKNVDKAMHKLYVTLRENAIQSALSKDIVFSGIVCDTLLPSYFQEVAQFTSTISTHVPGQLITAVLVAKLAHGWTFKVGTVDGLMLTHHTRGLSTAIGGSIDCRVLDVNPDGCLDLSARKPLVDVLSIRKLVNCIPPVESELLAKLTSLVGRDGVIEAEVEIVKRDYLVVSLTSFDRTIVTVSAKTYNDQTPLSSRFQCGQLIKTVISYAQPGHGRIFASHSTQAKHLLQPQVASGASIQAGHAVQAHFRKKINNKHLLSYHLINEGLPATLHITEIFDSYDSVPNKSNPFEHIVNRRHLDCVVRAVEGEGTKCAVHLCAFPSVTKADDKAKALEPKHYQKDQVVLGFVKKASLQGLDLLLTSSTTIQIPAIEVSSNFEIASNIPTLFTPHMAVECRVISVFPAVKLSVVRAEVKLPVGVTSYPAPLSDLSAYQPGTTVLAQAQHGFCPLVSRIISLPLSLPSAMQASVHITHLSDNFETLPEVKPDQLLECSVLSVASHQVHLSLRQSRLQPSSNHSIIDPEVSLAELIPGKQIRGFASGAKQGQGIVLNYDILACCSETSCKMKPCELVQTKVISADSTSVQVEVEKPAASKQAPSTISNLKCRVLKTVGWGVLVRVLENNTTALIHRSHIPLLDNANLDDSSAIRSFLASHFKVGSRILAWASKKKNKDRSLQLTLRPPKLTPKSDSSEPDEDSDAASVSDSESDDGSEEELESGDGLSQSEEEGVDEPMEVAPLDLEDGFEWPSASASKVHNEAMEVLDVEAEKTITKRKSKSHKHALPEDLTAQTRAPEVASDFEKAVLASPNSSLVWIQYMAYHLQMSALDKAREIAKRALATISLREEQERYNIHSAMLNLEFKFGDTASLDCVFQQAHVMVNRPKHLHLMLAKLYQDGAQPKKAEATYLDVVKKFPQSAKAWARLGEFYLDNGQLDVSRQTLQRSLKSLPKRKHLKAISQFAQLEFKRGEVERGRTLFEGIVANYSKRLDLWSIYLDMETKTLHQGSQDAEIVRRLFQRVLKLKWSSRKMKFLFKKYLAFEQTHGLPHHIDHVKGLALTYVQEMTP
ncbi:rRNA biogenesis protein rrp5 [Entomophthora muscae]|uniref:rRNA biogenesis protein rrp5 n=1 Tax=Entomophthora muscae TaxID=34485 RepID=A0ACC2SIM2_9FUNG|nr:rRNA biogenesis protein rrp5 [Entomophthora muscae]